MAICNVSCGGKPKAAFINNSDLCYIEKNVRWASKNMVMEYQKVLKNKIYRPNMKKNNSYRDRTEDRKVICTRIPFKAR